MPCLLDTSVLVRLANVNDSKHGIAKAAIVELHRRQERLHITPQVMIEFRNVATRLFPVNGLGLSAAESDLVSQAFQSKFGILADLPAIYPTWQSIVSGLGIIGKQVHDARLVAVCHVYSVSHVLTFNASHFSRMALLPPRLIVLEPSQL